MDRKIVINRKGKRKGERLSFLLVFLVLLSIYVTCFLWLSSVPGERTHLANFPSSSVEAATSASHLQEAVRSAKLRDGDDAQSPAATAGSIAPAPDSAQEVDAEKPPATVIETEAPAQISHQRLPSPHRSAAGSGGRLLPGTASVPLNDSNALARTAAQNASRGGDASRQTSPPRQGLFFDGRRDDAARSTEAPQHEHHHHHHHHHHQRRNENTRATTKSNASSTVNISTSDSSVLAQASDSSNSSSKNASSTDPASTQEAGKKLVGSDPAAGDRAKPETADAAWTSADPELESRERLMSALRGRQRASGDSRHLTASDRNDDVILPFGRVMRQLSQRILGRPRKSRVLVAVESRRAAFRDSVGASLWEQARRHGHETHLMMEASNESLARTGHEHADQWWSSQQPEPAQQTLLLSVFDRTSPIFSSDGAASRFLTEGPALKYVILTVKATTGGCELPPYNYTFEGTAAVRLFLNHNYKVQVLSVSDFWNETDMDDVYLSHRGPNPVFMPNDLLTEENLMQFLEWGARSAAMSKSLMKDRTGYRAAKPAIFQAYLFCTQGLDLAIPSRREYIVNGSFAKVRWALPYNNILKQRMRTMERINFKKCPQDHQVLKIEFRNATGNPKLTWNAVRIKCSGLDVTERARASGDQVHLWSSTNDASKAEAVCVKLNCANMKSSTSSIGAAPSGHVRLQVACTTRTIVPSHFQAAMPAGMNELPGTRHVTNVTANSMLGMKPNVLVLVFNSLSRSQFEFIMPKTSSLLQNAKSKFTSFTKFTPIGESSQHELMALFAGKDENRTDATDKPTTWLWEKFSELGYATFKAEDKCIANNGWLQSPNVTHGAALQQLMCFHFARPNCVGSTLAAQHLLNHTQQFIDTYHSTNPWAAFVSLVDTEEDTHTLGAIIDDSVANFLNRTIQSDARLRNAAVVVMSTQGLDYGPYFQTAGGERERYQPFLCVRSPVGLHLARELNRNAGAWVTPLDVRATLLDMISVREERSMHGMSLYDKSLLPSRETCQDASAIPNSHCEILSPSSNRSLVANFTVQLPSVPSLMAFYADIPRDHRFKNDVCEALPNNVTSNFEIARASGYRLHKGDYTVRLCTCSTSHQGWLPCTESPWGRFGRNRPEETFLLLSCPNRSLFYKPRILRNEKLIAQLPKEQPERQNSSRPNILIIEVDSVSTEFADRHFSKTRTLLNRHRAARDTCAQGLCAVDFPGFGVVGPNSIANQVASLSGCFTTLLHPSCFGKDTRPEIGQVCHDASLYEYGMVLMSLGPRQHTVFCPANNTQPPLLYDIAKHEGYVTFFGEEFCYPNSPWVFQDNVFPIKADIELHPVFCRLMKRRYQTESESSLYKYASSVKCTGDGTTFGTRTQNIGLDMLRQMWDAYSNVPKFAYLNALAAHVYTRSSPLQALDAEEYDESLSRFLEALFQRSDANNTVVVVRSDHGLQGGKTHVLDYSTQMEHGHPWTEIVVPESYPVNNLMKNSERFVTPFDLYTTLKDLLVHGTGVTTIPSKRPPSTPSWSTNLLHEFIDSSKSCADRKILPEYCPSSRDISLFPNFGVCNSFEKDQAIFCRNPTNGGSIGGGPNATTTDTCCLTE